MRLIDADQLLQKLQKDPLFPLVEQYGITRVIEAAPTVQPEPIHYGARWVWDEVLGAYLCGRCKSPAYGETENIYIGLFDFCPYCGAKMEPPEKRLTEEQT